MVYWLASVKAQKLRCYPKKPLVLYHTSIGARVVFNVSIAILVFNENFFLIVYSLIASNELIIKF